MSTTREFYKMLAFISELFDDRVKSSRRKVICSPFHIQDTYIFFHHCVHFEHGFLKFREERMIFRRNTEKVKH